MNILGIDYGRKKIGLAVAESDSRLAEPLGVVRFGSEEEMIGQVEKVIKAGKVERIVLGISEGKMAEETKSFGSKLQERLGITVEFHDETLTTQRAQELSIQAGIKRKKRKGMEDAYAASLMLQDYLELQSKNM